MGKDLKGKELGTGLRQRKDGRYEARAKINGIDINLYDVDLKKLKILFEKAKEEARNNIDMKRQKITLNEWFEEWFANYKIPNIKETSVFPMRSKYYNTFGKAIGNMKVTDIRNLDIQRVINDMNKQGRASSSMRDALGRVRECLESAKNNRIIDINPCFEINVPWENKTAERRFLSMAEQTRFLQEVEHNWYKEMFYIMFLTGMRIGEVGGLKWEDIDWNKKCINIQRSLSCQYENGVKTMRLTKPKTHNSYRSIPFMAETEEILLSQKEKQNRQKKAYGNRWRSSGEFDNLVFTTSLGSPVIRNVAEKEIKKVVKAINFQEAIEAVKENREPIEFKDLYPHAIRHTFCSRCFEKGMDAKYIEFCKAHQLYSVWIGLLNHMTCNVYLLIEPEIQKYLENKKSKMEQMRKSINLVVFDTLEEGNLLTLVDMRGNKYELNLSGMFCPDRGASNTLSILLKENEEIISSGMIEITYGDYDITEDGIPIPYVEDELIVDLTEVKKYMIKILDKIIMELRENEQEILNIEI